MKNYLRRCFLKSKQVPINSRGNNNNNKIFEFPHRLLVCDTRLTDTCTANLPIVLSLLEFFLYVSL